MAKASGSVFRSGGKERISHATIKAWKGGQILYATTDEAGEFNLDIPQPGTWSLAALEKESYASQAVDVDMAQDQYGIKIYMERVAETQDDKAGLIFFWVIFSLFILLIIGYILTHLFIKETPSQVGFIIWSKDPFRFLEILLWGLAGILVSKLFTTGWYLRSRRFYREGILMHIAHIATTPLLVLVTVLILSLVTMKFTLAGGNEITIDLSDPRIMVAFAFIIGTSPWPLWNFIMDSAKRFTGKLS